MNRIRNLDIAIAAVLIGVDQWTKWLVVKGMGLYESIPLIPDLLNITHVRNTGGPRSACSRRRNPDYCP